VDGALYNFLLEYQDASGNPKKEAVSNGVNFAGYETIPPLFSSPATSTSIPDDFHIDFTLYEKPYPGSVKMIFTHTGGLADPHSERVVTFSFENSGRHSFICKNLSTAAAEQAEILSVSPAEDLVIGGVYSIRLEYQDAVRNKAVNVTHTNIAFAGLYTLAPSFFSPYADSAIPALFLINFTLPERSFPGSVKMRLQREGGLADVAGERVILFSSLFESAGNHNVIMQILSLSSSLSAVSSITPSDDLVDGTIYSIALEYQDGAANPVSRIIHKDITYAGVDTITPNLFNPVELSSIPLEWGVEFEIFERATQTLFDFDIVSLYDSGIVFVRFSYCLCIAFARYWHCFV
jgi:hypothetical protein